MCVANGGKGPTEVVARCGRDVAAGMGALAAGAGAAGPPHPKRALGGFMVKGCKGIDLAVLDSARGKKNGFVGRIGRRV